LLCAAGDQAAEPIFKGGASTHAGMQTSLPLPPLRQHVHVTYYHYCVSLVHCATCVEHYVLVQSELRTAIKEDVFQMKRAVVRLMSFHSVFDPYLQTPCSHLNIYAKLELDVCHAHAHCKLLSSNCLYVQDTNDLKEALRHASAMLAELRTGHLTPKVYYELYMEVFNNLGFIEQYFTQLLKGGMPMTELYEMVQHAGNVLVRLYVQTLPGCKCVFADCAVAVQMKISP
jgi:hypothetical protein